MARGVPLAAGVGERVRVERGRPGRRFAAAVARVVLRDCYKGGQDRVNFA